MKRWSFSMLETFEQCPKKYEYRYILKHPSSPPDPDGPLARGNQFHSEIEDYITGKADDLHKRFAPFRAYIDDVKATPGLEVERLVAVNNQWLSVPADSGQAWLRYKLDAKVPTSQPHEIRVIDWKTGKVYPSKHFDQASLYALGMFAEHPEIKLVQTEFVYLDQRQMTAHTITAGAAPKLRENFERRVVVMHDMRKFPTSPSRLCAWCDYSVTKGGPCPETGK